MNQYELLLILNSNLSNAELEDSVGEVKKLIGESGGEVKDEESWGKRRLAYKIKDQSEGNFFILSFSHPSEKMREVQKKLGRKEEILRILLVRND